MGILEEIGSAGGLVSNEHPKDPGMDPYPSTWNLTEMKRVEKKLKMVRCEFPQCLWGMESEKQTCISSNLSGIKEFDVHGDGKCRHAYHSLLIGRDEQGRFRTRRAQTYPAGLCRKLAELYVRDWLNGAGNPTEITVEDWEKGNLGKVAQEEEQVIQEEERGREEEEEVEEAQEAS